ncbi:MAG: PilN domain-containing protein [Puniceicoccales bacterium]|nr:PilN domain-containing protein [Puniceicoccales bacterium]
MRFKFEKLKQLASQRLWETRETFCLVPSQLFFVVHVDFPENEKLNEKKVEELVRLSLEGQSPFDLSDLLWGSLAYASKKGLLVYATSKEILKRSCPEALSATYCLPSFVPFFLEDASKNGLCRFSYGKERVLFRLTKDGYWEGFDSSSGEDVASGAIDEMTLENVVLSRRGFIFVGKKDNEHSFELALPFHSSVFWAANLHDFDLRQKRRTEKRTETFCYYTTLTTTRLLVGVLVSWICLQFVACGVRRDAYHLLTEEPWIARVKQKEDLLHELALFSKQKQVYFRILDRLNNVRPDSILFFILRANNGREFEIEGAAQRVDDVHRYVAELQDDPTLTVVELRRVTSRNNEVKFSLYVEFEERV